MDATLPAARRSRTLLGLAIILGALAANAVGASIAGAKSGAQVVGFLPARFQVASSVWTGSAAYVLGGYANGPCVPLPTMPCPALSGVYEFVPTPGAPSLARKVLDLPWGLSDAPAVWDPRDRPEAGCPGGCAYVFGGWRDVDGAHAPSDEIVRFNPSTLSVAVEPAKLPVPLVDAAAVWDGTRARVFGGFDAAAFRETDAILEYDPVAREISTMRARLPNPLASASAVWDPRPGPGCPKGCAYVLGGFVFPLASTDSPPQDFDTIVKYEPARDAATLLDARLPEPRFYAAAVWTGSTGLLLGGAYVEGNAGHESDEVVEFSPGTQDPVRVLDERLPYPLAGETAAWTGSDALLLGGGECCDLALQVGTPRWVPTETMILAFTPDGS